MSLPSVNQEKTPCIAEILHVNHMPEPSISDPLYFPNEIYWILQYSMGNFGVS